MRAKARPLPVKLRALDGAFIKFIEIPYFMEELSIKVLKKPPCRCGECRCAPIRAGMRFFKFHDREGRFYIYKEVSANEG